MMINRARPRVHTRAPAIGCPGTALVLAFLLASCVSGGQPPPPPRVAPQPVARATTTPTPAPVVRQATDWRDRELTPGDWHYAAVQGGSTARYGEGPALFALTCDTARRTVTLTRALDAAPPAASLPATLVTTTNPHPLSGTVSGARLLTIAFAATDSTLDEMAFSRGRFAFEASGEPTLILPAWEEVGRVIEDCR